MIVNLKSIVKETDQIEYKQWTSQNIERGLKKSNEKSHNKKIRKFFNIPSRKKTTMRIEKRHVEQIEEQKKFRYNSKHLPYFMGKNHETRRFIFVK